MRCRERKFDSLHPNLGKSCGLRQRPSSASKRGQFAVSAMSRPAAASEARNTAKDCISPNTELCHEQNCR